MRKEKRNNLVKYTVAPPWTCSECKDKVHELRPNGKNGAWICFDCDVKYEERPTLTLSTYFSAEILNRKKPNEKFTVSVEAKDPTEARKLINNNLFGSHFWIKDEQINYISKEQHEAIMESLKDNKVKP